MSKPSVYLIGSLRNPEIPRLGIELRNRGWDVFDDWFSAGPNADDCWRDYETERGSSYEEALHSYAAQHVFEFDKKHLERCEHAVLVMPAGKSGHLELGWCAGRGKYTYVLFDKEPERWDVMYQFTDGVYFSWEKFLKHFELL